MKPADIATIRAELELRPAAELKVLCLRLARFKSENKELLSYMLFDASDELGFIGSVKKDIDNQFNNLNTSHFYYTKKGVRKILRDMNKVIRISGRKSTEVELILHFCRNLNSLRKLFPSAVLDKIMELQVKKVSKSITLLHEDLRYDYEHELQEIISG